MKQFSSHTTLSRYKIVVFFVALINFKLNFVVIGEKYFFLSGSIRKQTRNKIDKIFEKLFVKIIYYNHKTIWKNERNIKYKVKIQKFYKFNLIKKNSKKKKHIKIWSRLDTIIFILL